MSAESLPTWAAPPPGGWTADEFFQLPDDGPRCELIDGELIVMSPQRAFHGRVGRRLINALEVAAPPGWQVSEPMTIRIDGKNCPEPDLLVIYPGVGRDLSRTSYAPSEVALAVEIVSPESRWRDRVLKPIKYAAAGIRHFWRIEEGGGFAPLVHVFTLNPETEMYAVQAVESGKLGIEEPFAALIDLDALTA